ncbi:hypothetical protein RUND412_004593 [Rhizina undulata]
MELVRPFISEREITNALLLGDAKVIHDLWIPFLDVVEPGFLTQSSNIGCTTYFTKLAFKILQSWITEMVLLDYIGGVDIGAEVEIRCLRAGGVPAAWGGVLPDRRLAERSVYARQVAPPKSFGRLKLPDSDILHLRDYTLSCIRAQMEGCQQLRVTISQREKDLKKREEILRKHMQSPIMVFDQRASGVNLLKQQGDMLLHSDIEFRDAQARKVTAMLDNAITIGPSSLDVWNAFCN